MGSVVPITRNLKFVSAVQLTRLLVTSLNTVKRAKGGTDGYD